MKKMYDKENIYDAKIAPLMKQIIDICKEEELAFTTQFYLKEEREDTVEPMYCTSFFIPARKEMNDDVYLHMTYICEAMKYGPDGKPFVMSAMISRK